MKVSLITVLTSTLLLVGCVTEPKAVLQTQVPSGLTRSDVQLGILAATGLNLPEGKQMDNWQAMVDNVLQMIPIYKSPHDFDNEKWIFETIDPSTIYTSYQHGDEMLRARVDYNASTVTYRIDGSRNMKESGDKIHREANSWLENLRMAVARSIGRVQAMKMGYTNKPRDIDAPKH